MQAAKVFALPDEALLRDESTPHNAVLDCVCNEDFITGIEIASAGELEAARKFCTAQRIIFTGSGKTEYELEEAIKSGIQLINVESLAEAVCIARIARRFGHGEGRCPAAG